MINPTRFSLTCLAFVFPVVAQSQAHPPSPLSGEKAPHFFFRSDWDEDFRDQDKFGHLLGGYQLTRAGYESPRASCVSEQRAVAAAVAYAALFQLQIEIFGGMYKKYGFSYAAAMRNRAKFTQRSELRSSRDYSITDYVDPVTVATQRARRKLFLSIDIDPERLPGENAPSKAVKHQLSYYHFPSPALQLTPSLRGISWYR